MLMASVHRLHLPRHLRAQFAIDWQGHHGGTHWTRAWIEGYQRVIRGCQQK